MKKRKIFWSFFLLFSLFSAGLYSQDRKNPFLAEWDDSVQKVKIGDSYTLKIKFHVPEGYFLYRDKTEVNLSNLADLTLVKKVFPPSKLKYDPFSKKEVQVYLHDFEVILQLKAPLKISTGRRTLEGEVRYQGCSQDFCYRPVKTALLVPFELVSSLKAEDDSSSVKKGEAAPPLVSPPTVSAPPLESPNSPQGFWSLLKEGRLESLLKLNPFVLLLLAFFAGILTDLTPCVLPIIPLTLAVVGVQKNRPLSHNLAVSLFLVLGIAVTYTVLGLFSAFLGLRLGFLFQSAYFLGFLILFFIVMSLSMLGVIRLELPMKVRNFLGKVGGMGLRGAFLAGLTIGFIASPCVGPLVGPLLLWVAQSQDVVWGAAVLLVYGLGMGTLFFVTGAFFSTLGSKIRGGAYTEVLKKSLAVLILLPALYYGYVLYNQSFGKTSHEGWVASLQEGLKTAREEKKPVLIDFFADWCLPCLELDRKTFSNFQVKRAMEDFVRIKIDCTLETANCSEAVNRFGVIGWPTVIFLGKDQKLHHDLSIVGGFVGPEKMEKILSEVKKRG